MIEIYKIKIAHSDERRDILEMFNGNFDCKQVKILKARKGAILGNHYHKYREIRYLLKGKIKYKVEDVLTKEKKEFIMNEDEIMMTNPYVAHQGEFLEDSIIIEGTEDIYINGEINDIKWTL